MGAGTGTIEIRFFDVDEWHNGNFLNGVYVSEIETYSLKITLLIKALTLKVQLNP